MGDDLWRNWPSSRIQDEYAPAAMLINRDKSPYLARFSQDSATARATLSHHANCAYGTHEDEVLDFFPAARDNAPLHVFVHGGFWQALSHQDAASFAPMCHSQDVAFATINYTIAPKGTLHQMVEQTRQALVWLVDNADKMGIDAQRISASGHSAGAHLLASALLTPIAEQAAITRVTLISGIFELEPLLQTPTNDALALDLGQCHALSVHQRPIHGCQHIVVAAGQYDTQEFIRQSKDYADWLNEQGCQAEFACIPEVNHFDIILNLNNADDPLAKRLWPRF